LKPRLLRHFLIFSRHLHFYIYYFFVAQNTVIPYLITSESDNECYGLPTEAESQCTVLNVGGGWGCAGDGADGQHGEPSGVRAAALAVSRGRARAGVRLWRAGPARLPAHGLRARAHARALRTR
jgi:hypothetical protein